MKLAEQLEYFYYEILRKNYKKDTTQMQLELRKFCEANSLKTPDPTLTPQENFKQTLKEITKILNLKLEKTPYYKLINEIKNKLITNQITNLNEISTTLTIEEIKATQKVLNALKINTPEINSKLEAIEEVFLKEKQNKLIAQLNNLIKETADLTKLNQFENLLLQF